MASYTAIPRAARRQGIWHVWSPVGNIGATIVFCSSLSATYLRNGCAAALQANYPVFEVAFLEESEF